MKTSVIHPSTFKLDGGAMFGIIPKPMWEKKIKPDEFNRILMSLRVVLFETKNKKILVDTGIGSYHSDKFKEQFAISESDFALEKALKTKNITPEDITDIILTHLHFDHVGGIGTKNGELVFKNATIHVHKKHLEYSQNATLKDQGSFHTKHFLPLLDKYKELGRLNLLDELEGEILNDENESINFKASFGHTPYMIHPYNNEYIYMADLVPMRHHVHIPWVMGYDIEPAVTTTYKQKFYDFISEKNLSMIFEHDNETVSSTLIKGERKYETEKNISAQKEKVQPLP